MDFLAICQGLGLAIAAGLIIGVVLPSIMPTWGVIAGAAPLGALACAAALSGEDEAIWPALPIGILAAGLAAIVSGDVASGAARRQAQGTDAEQAVPSAVVAYIVLAAILLAALSLVVPPVSLLAAAALVWLWVNRRRREERKHEGLRVLR